MAESCRYFYIKTFWTPHLRTLFTLEISRYIITHQNDSDKTHLHNIQRAYELATRHNDPVENMRYLHHLRYDAVS